MKNTLSPDTKLKLVAIHNITFEEKSKIITYSEWLTMIKNKNYYYRAYQVI